VSEEKTQEKPDARSFEDRVFARFDAMDERFNGIDARLQKLEAKQYDTKPIWERALAEIAETRNEIREELRRVGDKIDILNKNILEAQADTRGLERRVSKLESDEGGTFLVQ
jgi:archaellum component FlaC